MKHSPLVMPKFPTTPCFDLGRAVYLSETRRVDAMFRLATPAKPAQRQSSPSLVVGGHRLKNFKRFSHLSSVNRVSPRSVPETIVIDEDCVRSNPEVIDVDEVPSSKTASSMVHEDDAEVQAPRPVAPDVVKSKSSPLKLRTEVPKGRPLACPPMLMKTSMQNAYLNTGIPSVISTQTKTCPKSRAIPTEESKRATKRLKTKHTRSSSTPTYTTIKLQPKAPAFGLSADQRIFVEAAAALCEADAVTSNPLPKRTSPVMESVCKKRKRAASFSMLMPPPPFVLPRTPVLFKAH